jgi:hypothetical protein
MPERVAWTQRLLQIARWALIGVGGLAAGLAALFFTVSFLWSLSILVRLLGAKLGLWEFDLALG